MTTCDKCRGSRWVPTDGERDAITEEPRFAFQLLIPTAWMPCTCSPLWSLHPDLVAVTNLDVWRCEGVTEFETVTLLRDNPTTMW